MTGRSLPGTATPGDHRTGLSTRNSTPAGDLKTDKWTMYRRFKCDPVRQREVAEACRGHKVSPLTVWAVLDTMVYRSRDGLCDSTKAQLAKESVVNVQQVGRAIDRLKVLRLIEVISTGNNVKAGPGRGNVYQLTLPAPSTAPTADGGPQRPPSLGTPIPEDAKGYPRGDVSSPQGPPLEEASEKEARPALQTPSSDPRLSQQRLTALAHRAFARKGQYVKGTKVEFVQELSDLANHPQWVYWLKWGNDDDIVTAFLTKREGNPFSLSIATYLDKAVTAGEGRLPWNDGNDDHIDDADRATA